MHMSKTLLLAIVLVTQSASSHAQVYTENFNGTLPSVMLNGIIAYGVNGPWSTRIADGALELQNLGDDKALRYYKVERVIYPGSTAPASTDDATIEAIVRVSGDERAGAGVMTRFDPKTSNYLLFTIGPRGTFSLLLRKDGKASFAGAGTHDAIRVGEFNRVRARTIGNTIIFEVNDREVARIAGDETPGRLVGIGAFGRGTYQFDEVRVAPPGVELPPAR
jgi:hypothetical protein